MALHSPEAEGRARFIAERLFLLAATAALARSAPPAVTEAYALTRLASPSRMIGANDLGPAVNPLLERAFVAI
jgi:putative acyl-CoA dehydrogenase